MPTNWLILALCIFVFAMAMVKMAATYVVGTYGIAVGLAVIALIIFGAHLIDRIKQNNYRH